MTYTAFSYKQGNSIIHRCPAWIKILIIPIINLLFFKLPPLFVFALFVLQMLLSFLLRFSLREQLSDLKAVVFYAILLIFTKLIAAIAVIFSNRCFNLPEFSQLPGGIINFLLSEKETWILLLKLFCVMQSASIIFKTSTSLELREGLAKIELFLRRPFLSKKKTVVSTPVSEAVAIFICFIPQVSKNWTQAKLAWQARGGKRNFKMLYVLLPVFFSVGMKQAYNSARAIAIRK